VIAMKANEVSKWHRASFSPGFCRSKRLSEDGKRSFFPRLFAEGKKASTMPYVNWLGDKA